MTNRPLKLQKVLIRLRERARKRLRRRWLRCQRKRRLLCVIPPFLISAGLVKRSIGRDISRHERPATARLPCRLCAEDLGSLIGLKYLGLCGGRGRETGREARSSGPLEA